MLFGSFSGKSKLDLTMTRLDPPKIHAIATPMGNGYIKGALLLAEQARSIEEAPPLDAFDRHTIHHSLVTSSLLNSACALEATINEWYSFADEIEDLPDPGAAERIRRLWEAGIPRTASFHILQKYQVGLALMGKVAFLEGEEPFQSARLVVDLRNWLVHYEPTWEPMADHEETGEYPPHKLVRRLKGKFKPNPLSQPGVPFWPYKCLGSGCALWAAEAVVTFMDNFFSRCDPSSVLRPERDWLDRARKLGSEMRWQKGDA